MRPGLTIIKKCAACFKLIEERTVASGNNFGASYWTDGFQVTPFLPMRSWLVKCPHCQTLAWLDELEKVGSVDPFEDLYDLFTGVDSCNEKISSKNSNQFEDAMAYHAPTIDDYFSQLESGINSAQKVFFLRRAAWWLGNDARRGNANPAPMSIRETSNLEAFAVMLDKSNDNNILTKAEAMRELGQFVEALALLVRVRNQDYAHSVSRIQQLCMAGNIFVQQLDEHSYSKAPPKIV